MTTQTQTTSGHYADSPACKMLATNCCACGRPLVDADSVENGIGPVCREKWGYDKEIDAEARVEANKLVYEASAINGASPRMREIIDRLNELGLTELANKVFERIYKPIKITVEPVPFGSGHARYAQGIVVESPYNADFVSEIKLEISWKERTIVKDDKDKFRGWAVTLPCKRALWKLLKKHYGGHDAVGPKGPFRV